MTYNDPNVPSDSERPAPPRPLFRPQPPRFWQIVLKDVAVTVVGVTLFCFLCFMIFVGSIALLASSLGSVGGEKSSLSETTIRGNDSSEDKVVVLPIEGIIETDETGFIPEAIDAIRDDKRVRALVLRVNSPGGTISGSDYYLHLLKKLKAELEIPIIFSRGDMATSGGYYISTVGDKIVAERSTVTGSIGVIISMYNAAELCKKLGVRSNAITSGAMKGMGDFMKEPTPEETAIWQKSVDDSYEQFLEVVKEGRAYYRGDEDAIANEPKHEQLAGVKVKTIDETPEETPTSEEPGDDATTELANDEETGAAETEQSQESAAETAVAQEKKEQESP
ncbi:MAG: signal peptide peptidase SppA, partial [Thermoguttaceae bacterium]|nr:signal peptide peptidase SppA [Thermoguttaceae bacterium]